MIHFHFMCRICCCKPTHTAVGAINANEMFNLRMEERKKHAIKKNENDS